MIEERQLSIEQQNAIELCSERNRLIVGVTGGAGTGKTTLLKLVYEQAKAAKLRVALCAPTGRAAKRIQEITSIPAMTIHRLLEYPAPDEDGTPGVPKRDKSNRLEFDMVIVDEASMLAPSLYRQLIDALPVRGCIRFFGDNNQLPPVEDGMPPFIKVLEKFPSIILTHNYRSDDAIVSNAMRVLNARQPIRNDSFEVVVTDTPLTYLYKEISQDFALDENQIIMPTRRGAVGTMVVNARLQRIFNGKGKTLQLDRLNENDPMLTIRKDDKFLWVKNDYQIKPKGSNEPGIYNGEIGRVLKIDHEEGSFDLVTADNVYYHIPPRLKVWSVWHESMIDYDPRKQLELGYAITTHKSQGSEFDTVIYVLCNGARNLIGRRNFYTAITRARHRVIVVAERAALKRSMIMEVAEWEKKK